MIPYDRTYAYDTICIRYDTIRYDTIWHVIYTVQYNMHTVRGEGTHRAAAVHANEEEHTESEGTFDSDAPITQETVSMEQPIPQEHRGTRVRESPIGPPTRAQGARG